MAAGRVCIGFSLPYVAAYSESSGTITYSSGQKLARGVDVTITPTTSSDNEFYADNAIAENGGGAFAGGTFALTVDGLLVAAEKLIMGLPAAASNSDWVNYDDDQSIPYVGLGYIAKYMSDGTITYVPTILKKARFNLIENAAATQGAEIDWQTQALSGNIYRADDAKHTWKMISDESYTSESAAEAALKTALNII